MSFKHKHSTMPNHIKRNSEIIQYVENNWKTGVRIKELSSLFNLDASDVERIFRNAKGITIKRFIDDQRKNFLLSVLTQNYVLGYMIARELGFLNEQSFSHWVKRVFGVSYRSLRKKATIQ